jgi:hypothetical protein
MMANPSRLFAISPTLDRVGMTDVDGLRRLGFLTGRTKWAVVHGDSYELSFAAAVKREAAAYGMHPTDEATICQLCSSQEQSNEAQNAVVKFRAEGVDHVLLVTAIAGQSYMLAEEAQGYRPRLAVTSFQVPELEALITPAAYFQDAVGIGWTPTADVDSSHDGPENQTPARQQCTKTMHDAGVQYNDRLVEVNAMYNCDLYYMLKAIVDRAGRADATALEAATESLGSGFAPATSWSAWFGPGRHDGVQQWRPLAYQVSCTCFVYTGGLSPFSHLAGQQQ